MRVGIDARLLYYQQGGISTYTRCLIRELSSLRKNEQYVVLQSRKDVGSAVDGNGLEIARLWTPCHHRLEQVTLPVELAPLKLDLLHSPDFIPPRFGRCKSVITVHDLAFLKFPHLLTSESKSYYSQIGRAVKSADAIISVSVSTKKDLVQELGVAENKITVIPEAADDMFRPMDDRVLLDEVKRRYGLPDRFVLFLGTIEPRKNLTTLIEAFARVVEKQQTAVDERSPRLVIAGAKGWLHDEVFAKVEDLQIGDLVTFIGSVSGRDLAPLYNLAEVFAMPSLYEGFGLPVLEAMACGTPVIASNSSSLAEVAGDAALLANPLDVDEWVKAISRSLNDGALREDLRQRGLRRARDFSWRRTALETREVYQRVLGR